MFIIMLIVLLAAATEARYYVKMLSISDKIEVEILEIISFENASVSRKEIWNKVNEGKYVTYRKTNGYENKDISLQIIAADKSEKIDSKTATSDLVHIDGAEIFLEVGAKYYVARILDFKSNMLLDHFTYNKETAKVKQICQDSRSKHYAVKYSSVLSQSIWKNVTEIYVKAPKQNILLTKTPGNTQLPEVKVENATFLVKVEAKEGVKHMAPLWVAELNEAEFRMGAKHGVQHPFKAYKYTGLFRFKVTHMSVGDIYDAVEQDVFYQAFAVIIGEFCIEMEKGTKSVEVNWNGVIDRKNKIDEKIRKIIIDVTTITDVIIGVWTPLD